MVSRKSGWAGPLGPAPAWNFSSKPLVIRAGEAGLQTSVGTARRPAPPARAVMEPSQTPNVLRRLPASCLPGTARRAGSLKERSGKRPKGAYWM